MHTDQKSMEKHKFILPTARRLLDIIDAGGGNREFLELLQACSLFDELLLLILFLFAYEED